MRDIQALYGRPLRRIGDAGATAISTPLRRPPSPKLANGRTLRTPSHGYCRARRLALGLVALEEARHEELLGQRRQAHAAGLRRTRPAASGRRDRRPRSSRAATAGSRRSPSCPPAARLVVRAGPSACCRRSARSTRPRISSSTAKRWNCGVISVPPQKMPVMPAFFSEMRSHSASSSFGVVNRHLIVVRLEQRERLVDDVLLVRLHLSISPPLDELDHPARVEVEHEADAAAMLGEVLDGEAQAARAASGRPAASRRPCGKYVVGQRVAEHLVVDAEVVDVDARLRHARCCRRSRRRRSGRPA